MAVIPVETKGGAYEVRIASGLLGAIAVVAGPLLRKECVPIVTDANVRRHWGGVLAKALDDAGYEPRWHVVEPGESAKNWAGLQALTDWLLAEGVERGDHVLALGGGVIGDLTGFACAILKRGCGFIQLPTTLLAQVDSSVGGKTAINAGAGKNLIGAFHQPALVLADISALSTLPVREMRAGYAEVIKYGILGDTDFFHWCEAHGSRVVAGDGAALEEAVARSVAAKARIVAEDESETTGVRALLNLGHTFGHALEAETGFSNRLLHGEGVAMGMVLAARYSMRRGLLDDLDAQRITAAIAAAGLRTDVAALDMPCDGAALVEHMRHDKKMDSGTLPFILLRGIGAAFLNYNVSLNDMAEFLDEELNVI